MKIKLKIPNLKKKINFHDYFKDQGLKNLTKQKNILKDININQLPEDLDFILPTELNKLYSLEKLIVLNKRINVLEFGSGSSTVIFSHSLNKNKLRYHQIVKKNIRRAEPFTIISIETYKKFAIITKKKLKENLGKRVKNFKIFISKVNMTTFNGRICTEYSRLPKFSPDFIYLDGPDQRNVFKKVNNISTDYSDFFPMSCDILKIEFFLTPGTIIVVDGRGANAEFLKKHFIRNWSYKYIKEVDFHIFTLIEKPLGKYNLNQIKFYKNN